MAKNLFLKRTKLSININTCSNIIDTYYDPNIDIKGPKTNILM